MNQPYTAYIVECVRSAGGKNKGLLSGIHPVDLGAAALDALTARVAQLPRGKDGKLADGVVDDVVCGCVSQVGAQGESGGAREAQSTLRRGAATDGNKRPTWDAWRCWRPSRCR